MKTIEQLHYLTDAGVRVQRAIQQADYETAIPMLRDQLDSQRGVLLSSSFEYPGRYTRWDLGFINPPLVLTACGRDLRIEALNGRGAILLPEIMKALRKEPAVSSLTLSTDSVLPLLQVTIAEPGCAFPEEERSRQPSVFSALRAITAHFHSARDSYLGLYGAFGYDLAFQFEPVGLSLQRSSDHRDLVLYMPDEIIVADHYAQTAKICRYEFVCCVGNAEDGHMLMETTGGLRRTGSTENFRAATKIPSESDHQPGEYAQTVRKAKEYFRRGDLFEVVPGQVFFEACRDSPAQIFARLQQRNPAPYGALMNLGQQEYLVSASPEMYVRVRGKEIETCPISGTIARGEDAMADARQIRELLNSAKDESELSMCTDVDRNDKARVCIPGSIEVAGRRQVELYSRLIHTVDHVKGTLQPQFDAMDAFLAHTWAVTVTGAPKAAAMQFIEETEKSPRAWYGGAIGCLGFNGDMNTGLTLRTIRVYEGIAEIRAGATLLMDSDPEAEEAETRLKASALRSAVRGDPVQPRKPAEADPVPGANSLRVLMVDHQDSFVHNLGSYFRAHGVQLQTMRAPMAREALRSGNFDLVLLSPGPGAPQQFEMNETLRLCLAAEVPVFGVCLGLQGIVEYFGGELGMLDYPMHGKPSQVSHSGGVLFDGIGSEFTAGRYHSLHASVVPDCLSVTARSSDGIVMAVEHRTLPVQAVQFHPESILTLEGGAGHRLIRNVVQYALSVQQAGCAPQRAAIAMSS